MGSVCTAYALAYQEDWRIPSQYRISLSRISARSRNSVITNPSVCTAALPAANHARSDTYEENIASEDSVRCWSCAEGNRDSNRNSPSRNKSLVPVVTESVQMIPSRSLLCLLRIPESSTASRGFIGVWSMCNFSVVCWWSLSRTASKRRALLYETQLGTNQCCRNRNTYSMIIDMAHCNQSFNSCNAGSGLCLPLSIEVKHCKQPRSSWK